MDDIPSFLMVWPNGYEGKKFIVNFIAEVRVMPYSEVDADVQAISVFLEEQFSLLLLQIFAGSVSVSQTIVEPR